MTFCYFTTPEHYPEFSYSVASVRQFHPNAKIVAIIRATDEKPQDQAIKVFRSDFERGQHLSGTPATIGVIQSLATIAALFSGPLVKIDSDMILREPFPNNPEGVCFRRPNGSFVGLYSLPSWLAIRLPEIISQAKAKGTVSLPSEAWRICGFAINHGINVKNISANLPSLVSCIPYGVQVRSKFLTRATPSPS